MRATDARLKRYASHSIYPTKVLTLEQAIHDADLEDGKFGRTEGHTMNQILRGWAAQDVPDDELLRRGMDRVFTPFSALPSALSSLRVSPA